MNWANEGCMIVPTVPGAELALDAGIPLGTTFIADADDCPNDPVVLCIPVKFVDVDGPICGKGFDDVPTTRPPCTMECDGYCGCNC